MLKQFIKPPVYVFIDAENLFYSQRTLGWLISDDRGNVKKWKASLDIEMALEMYKLNEKFATAALVSGDSDFAIVLDELKSKKKRVLVMSTRGHISKELLERAKYIDLRRLKNWLQK